MRLQARFPANDQRPSAPVHYVDAVDTDAIVRARRREDALQALEFEQGRETALLDQVNEVLVELDGPRIDAAAFANMEPEDVELVRQALEPTQFTPEEEWLELEGEPPARVERLRQAELQAEQQRLRQSIAECRRRQNALERYVVALGD
jgi:hypothetical protein